MKTLAAVPAILVGPYPSPILWGPTPLPKPDADARFTRQPGRTYLDFDYAAMGRSIILAAFDDAITEPAALPADSSRYDRYHRRLEIKARDQAREFLSTDNDDLRFWCRAAGIRMDALLDATNTGEWALLKQRMVDHLTRPSADDDEEDACDDVSL